VKAINLEILLTLDWICHGLKIQKMKKRLYLFFSLLISSISIFGQNDVCTIKADLPVDSQVLIYPMPFQGDLADPIAFGINKSATIGQQFEYTWTIVYPNSFIAPVVFLPAKGDTMFFFLDKTVFVRGTDTVGIPQGLKLEMFPENGVVLPNSQAPAACIKLSGTPSASVIPGTYKMFFSALICLDIPGTFTGCQPTLIPSLTAGFPGIYELVIKADGTTSVKETLNDVVSLIVSPNPFNDYVMIEFNSQKLSGDYVFGLFDTNGRMIESRNIKMKSTSQRIRLDGGDLNNGLFFYQLRGNDGIISGRLIHQK
jgi:hypothetical protein